jgi:hypothetical protein
MRPTCARRRCADASARPLARGRAALDAAVEEGTQREFYVNAVLRCESQPEIVHGGEVATVETLHGEETS